MSLDPHRQRVTDAVRDEAGSQLCQWVGNRRVCTFDSGPACRCESVASAVVDALVTGGYVLVRKTTVRSVVSAAAQLMAGRAG